MTIQKGYEILYNDFAKKSKKHLALLEELNSAGTFKDVTLLPDYKKAYDSFDKSRTIYIRFFDEFVVNRTPNPNAKLSNKWVADIAMRTLVIALEKRPEEN